MHAPKRESFDLDAGTNTDPKGVVRAVDVYRTTPWGLYVARPTPGRLQFHYLESWLLPDLGLRVSKFWFNPGFERHQDFYLDVGRFTSGRVWRSEDHYLDLVVHTGRAVDLIDVDELLAALTAGHLDADTAETAIRVALRAVDGLARHGYHLDRWLAGQGLALTWRSDPPAATAR